MKTVLITGASTGLGLALAKRLLATTTHRVVVTARTDSLSRFDDAGLDPDRTVIRPLDVLIAAERRALVQELVEDFGGVDVLVNNAGLTWRSVVEHVQDEERRAQFEINFHGPMELVRLVLPGMRAKRAGRIINVSSVAGMMAMPTMAVYTASKFALEGATEALWYEVRPFGIKVSLVQPGFIRSDGHTKILMTEASAVSEADPTSAYHAHYVHMAPFIARLMNRTPTTPEKVAKVIARVMHQRWPKLRVPASWDAKAFYYLRRLLPRTLYHEVLYRMLPGIRQWGRSPLPASPSTPAPKLSSKPSS